MSSSGTDQAVFNPGAAAFAFHVGQVVEQILLERGQEAAELEGARLVTLHHVESSLEPGLLDQALDRLKEASRDRTGRKPAACIHREAA